jgi:outer membrane autotransporter protein
LAAGGVSVNSGGTVSPGNSIGTLNVTGTYTQEAGSTYEVELGAATGPTTPGTDNDLIDVTGNAVINGGTIDVTASGNPDAGTIYTVLRTTTGVSGPGFAAATDSLLLRDFIVVQGIDNVQLLTTRVVTDFAGAAHTYNQQQVGAALDTLNPVATGDIGAVIDELFLLTDDQQRAAFDQISGELHGTLAIVGVQRVSYVNRLLIAQLSTRLLADARRNQSLISHDAVVPRAASVGDDYVVRGQDACCTPDWDAWVLGYGLGGSVQSDGNAAGLNGSLGGVACGIHRWFEDCTVAGLMSTFGTSFVRTSQPNQSADVDFAQVGGYLQRSDCDGRYYLLAGSVGWDDYQTSRAINFGGIVRTASARYHGLQGSAYVEHGWQTCCGGYTVRPLGALQYVRVHQNSFTETGAGGLSLAVDSADTDSLRGFLGMQATWCSSTRRGWRVRPNLTASWMHEFADTFGFFAATFNASGSPSFSPRGLNQGRDWALLGVGVTITPRENVLLYASYDVQMNMRQTFHIGNGGLQLRW